MRQLHDPQRLGQVLTNLIGNAIKFTPDGGRVTVVLHQTDEWRRAVASSTPASASRPKSCPTSSTASTAGAQAHESRAAGSGLGLSIVRSIVEMHNGRVSITSTPGKGTTVTVTLPRDMSVSSPAAVPSATSA